MISAFFLSTNCNRHDLTSSAPNELCFEQLEANENPYTLVGRRTLFKKIWTGIFVKEIIFQDQNAFALNMDLDSLEKEKKCADGTIVAESAIPGAYQQMCMQLPARTVTLRSTGEKITVLQGTNTAGGVVTGRTGVAVWNSGLLLTRLLDELGSRIFMDKTVLELGCGTGLASLAVAKLGAKKVFATDGNEEVVRLVKENAERNAMSSVIETSRLQWGLMDASEFFDAADIVIGSDLTYNPGTWRLLAETVSSVLKPGGIFLYLSLGHSGFNVSGEIDGFLAVAQNLGLIEVKGISPMWPLNGGARSLDNALRNRLTDEEKPIVEATGGVQVLLVTKKI